MHINKLLLGLLIITLLSSCATQKLTEEGNTAYTAGDYTTALAAWDQIIEKQESKGQKAEAKVYYKAGLAAHKLDQTKKASDYLETAEYLEFYTPKLYASLASIYQTIDNLSKEIEALENYHKKYPQGERIDTITVRLFETYVESENWKKALNLWPEIKDQAQQDAKLLAGYLIVNKNLENGKLADKLARQIIKLDPDNITALEYNAKKYFWKAENLYVSQMKAYKNNRTTSQYNKLLKAWKKVWPDFRKSRDYFRKLYQLAPKPEYAKFLGNIYKRMDKKQKANYWYNKAE